MLIVYKFNFKLPIICFLLVLRRGEKLQDVILCEQGTAQDSHDLHDWTSKLEIVLNDSDIFASNDFIFRTFLLTDDKEGSKHSNLVKSGKVKVASVKDIACQRLVCEPVHSIDIMHVGIGDSVEHGNLRDDVHLSVDFDARLCASELRPAKKRHTEVDSCGVHGIISI